MAQEIARERLGVRRHVERLVRGHAGVRAGGDVPHRIAAGFACRQPRIGEQPHRRLDIVELEKVQLHVLASGDVSESAGVALGDVGQRLELRLRQDSLWNFYAEHLRVRILPLTVCAAHETERPPFIRRDLAALEFRQHRHELVDVRLVCKRQPRAAERLPILTGVHNSPFARLSRAPQTWAAAPPEYRRRRR